MAGYLLTGLWSADHGVCDAARDMTERTGYRWGGLAIDE